MAVPFKLTSGQHDKIMNDPIHYDLELQFNGKTNTWEGECDSTTMKRIKAIVDEK